MLTSDPMKCSNHRDPQLSLYHNKNIHALYTNEYNKTGAQKKKIKIHASDGLLGLQQNKNIPYTCMLKDSSIIK